MGGMSIGNLPSQSILKKINDIAADVNDLDLEGVNNLKSKLSNLVAPELGNSDDKAISQKVVTENIQRLNTEVNNKISKVESAQTGNLPVFDNGNVKDSKIPSGNIAQQNGYYEGMVVGASRSLAGDNEVRAEYVFRPSGGTDIQSGTASINRVLGKTLVWNQLIKITDTSSVKGLVVDKIDDYKLKINGTITKNDLEGKSAVVIAHNTIKYPLSGLNKMMLNIKHISGSVSSEVSLYNGYFDPKKIGYAYIISPMSSAIDAWKSITFYLHINDDIVTFEDYIFSIQCFDLTQMFGEGNEPATVEEFEAMFPNDYYEYNEGTLISNDAVGIKSVGFNAWDEEWEGGGIAFNGLNNDSYTDTIRSKNYIPAISNYKYYFKSKTSVSQGDVFFYDINKQFISSVYGCGNLTFITPSNCAYIRVCTTKIYPPPYNHDICINLSHSGIRNGEYEPYEEHKLLFNKGNKLSAIKGKLNGEGDSVVVFPDGLRSAGNVRDEIVGNVAIRRIGAVDMGTLSWNKYNIRESKYVFSVTRPSYIKTFQSTEKANALTIKYPTVEWNNLFSDNIQYGFAISGEFLRLGDNSFTDINSFKDSLQGQILYYELAEPETYILDEALPMNYVVDDWGTEQRLVADENEVLAPLCYDVTYAINAVDTIRNMPKNYISEETMQAFLSAVGSAMGGTWSMTWNEDMQKYVFTFAPNTVVTNVE